MRVLCRQTWAWWQPEPAGVPQLPVLSCTTQPISTSRGDSPHALKLHTFIVTHIRMSD